LPYPSTTRGSVTIALDFDSLKATFYFFFQLKTKIYSVVFLVQSIRCNWRLPRHKKRSNDLHSQVISLCSVCHATRRWPWHEKPTSDLRGQLMSPQFEGLWALMIWPIPNLRFAFIRPAIHAVMLQSIVRIFKLIWNLKRDLH